MVRPRIHRRPQLSRLRPEPRAQLALLAALRTAARHAGRLVRAYRSKRYRGGPLQLMWCGELRDRRACRGRRLACTRRCGRQYRPSGGGGTGRARHGDCLGARSRRRGHRPPCSGIRSSACRRRSPWLRHSCCIRSPSSSGPWRCRAGGGNCRRNRTLSGGVTNTLLLSWTCLLVLLPAMSVGCGSTAWTGWSSSREPPYSQPIPSLSPSRRCGSDPITRTGAIPRARMWPQSTSGGYGGTQPPE